MLRNFSIIFLIGLAACAQTPVQNKAQINTKKIVRNNSKSDLNKSILVSQNNITPKEEELYISDQTPAPTPTPILEIKKILVGSPMDKLKQINELMNMSLTNSQIDELKSIARDLIQDDLNLDDLESIVDSSAYNSFQGFINYRIAEYYLDKKDKSTAKKFFVKASYFQPGSEISVLATNMIQQLDSSRHVEPKTIGVILPLTGKNSIIAQRTLRSIQLGLGLKNHQSSFKIAVIDSEGKPETARRGVERLVTEDNVIAIIGGLISKTATAEGSKAEELGVPILILSQKQNITDIGSSVFRNALTAQMQVRHLVKQSIEVEKLKKFAVLFPNDIYGVEFANIFWDEVLARGGKIVAAQSYNPKDTDFKQVAQRLVGTYYIEDRYEEFKLRSKELKDKEKDKKKSVRENTTEDILTPIVDFEAIFIPDTPKTMGQVAAFLSYTGVKNIKLLGTNLWNSPNLNKRAGLFAHNTVYVDGQNPFINSTFYQDYRQLYNEDPTLMDIQAYDSALIIKQLVLNGSENREDLTGRLKNLNQFPGSTGFLSISKDREILRPIFTFSFDKQNNNLIKIQ